MKSLEKLGGQMSREEVKDWGRQERWEEAIKLRRWEDEAKIVGKKMPVLEAYWEGMVKVLEAERGARKE